MGDTAKLQNALVFQPSVLNQRNQDNLTPLMLAVQMQQVEIVQALLAAGCFVNATDSKRNSCALSLASQRGDLDMIDKLLAAGAYSGIRDKSGLSAADYMSDQIHRLEDLKLVHFWLRRNFLMFLSGCSPLACTNRSNTSISSSSVSSYILRLDYGEPRILTGLTLEPSLVDCPLARPAKSARVSVSRFASLLQLLRDEAWVVEVMSYIALPGSDAYTTCI